MSGNQAVAINPSTASIGITEHGSDWYWTCFSVFGLFAILHAGFYVFYHRYNDNESRFKSLLHVGPLAAAGTLAYTYFTLASNLGSTPVSTEFSHVAIGNDERQVFYARYVGWFLSWPPLLFTFEINALSQDILTTKDFFQLASNLFLQITSIEVFVLGLLIGSLIRSTYKWGYWTFAATAQLFFLTIFLYRQFKSSNLSTVAKLVVAFFAIPFILYPVNWGLSEGGNVIQPDSEGVFYGVLDLIIFWLIPIVLIFDGRKNGQFIGSDPNQIASPDADLEKQEAPEIRHSGETEVNNEISGELETHPTTEQPTA